MLKRPKCKMFFLFADLEKLIFWPEKSLNFETKKRA
jgi:hypothetical protein